MPDASLEPLMTMVQRVLSSQREVREDAYEITTRFGRLASELASLRVFPAEQSIRLDRGLNDLLSYKKRAITSAWLVCVLLFSSLADVSYAEGDAYQEHLRGTATPSETDVEKWIYDFHAHPRPDLVVDIARHLLMRPAQSRGDRQEDDSFNRGFLIGVFRKYPERALQWVDQLQSLPADRMDEVMLSLWLSGIASARPEVTYRIQNYDRLNLRGPARQDESYNCGIASVIRPFPFFWKSKSACRQDKTDQERLSLWADTRSQHIFAIPEGEYIQKLYEQPMTPSDSRSSQWVYSILNVLGMKGERENFGMAMELWELQNELNDQSAMAKTVGQAILAMKQDPKSLDEWRNRALSKSLEIRWGQENEIPPGFLAFNKKWEPQDGKERYRWHGDSLWMDKNDNQKTVYLVLAITNTTNTPLLLTGFDLELGQGSSQPRLKLHCSASAEDADKLSPKATALLKCSDDGANPPIGTRKNLEEIRAAVRWMQANKEGLVLSNGGYDRGNDWFAPFDNSKRRFSLDQKARQAIQSTTCIQRGSCSKALGEAVMETLR